MLNTMLFPPQIRSLITSLVRRQSTDLTSGLDSANVPNQCFDACNRAALEAQASNNINIICAPHSVFLDLRVDCTTCIERFIAADNGTASQQDLGPTFQQWINYCDSVQINNSTQEVDINALLSSWSSLAATQSALQQSLSSLGYDFSTTATTTEGNLVTNTAATLGGDSTLTPTASPADAAAGNRDGNRTNPGDGSESLDVGVVVSAVVVPVVALSLVMVLVSCVLMRRRRRRRIEAQQRQGILASSDGYEGKAQLHSDPFRPELDGRGIVNEVASTSRETSVMAELPAREPVGGEMDSSSERRDP